MNGLMASTKTAAVRLAAWLFLALCLASVFIGAIAPKMAFATDEISARYINVVYDDSTSMNPGTQWCQAHYAIEVFAAMLGENDELRVFTMSAADAGDKNSDLVISGSEPMEQRVAKAHQVFSRIDAWTNFGAADSAYADLSQRPASSERWLVVLTDGGFTMVDDLTVADPGANASQDQINARVSEHLADWASQGVNVEYVGLGSDAVAFDGQGKFSSQIISADDILSGVINESNKIFGRASLPQSSIHGDSVDLGVPMGKIIVFAQGANVELGDLVVAGESCSPSDLADVHYADKPNASQTPEGAATKSPIDESLQGVVATYESESGFQAGTAQLDVKNADTIEVYYQPYVDVALTLTDTATGEATTLSGFGQASLQPGTYRSEYQLLDPFTGEQIHSDLISSTSFETQLAVEGTEPVAIPDGGEVSIPEGRAELVGVATINDEVVVPQRYDVTILAKELDLAVLSKPEGTVDVHDLDAAEPIMVKVTKRGADLTPDEAIATTLAIGSPDAEEPEGLLGWLFGSPCGIDSEWKATDQPGVYEVRLKAYNGEPADTLDGDVPITVKATYDPGYGQSYGELNTTEQIQGVGLLERVLHWILSHLLQLWLLILLALLIAFIVMELRKPRLPKIKPCLAGVKDGEDLQLVYAQKNKKHVIWPPWAPETNMLKVSVKGQPPSTYKLADRFPLGEKRIGIVASKTKRGKKGFRLSDNTLATLDKHKTDEWLASNGKYVNPSYSGERMVFTPGGGFNFQGKKPHKKKGWSRPEESTYRISF